MPEIHAPTFVGVIVKDGINYLVVIPASVTGWFDQGRTIPVHGLVNGVGIRATLVPKPPGRHSLFLNAEMRTELAVTDGADVEVTLWLDESDRSPVVPPDVKSAFARQDVMGSFDGRSISRQRMILVWIEDAKRDETRLSRIARSVEHLKRR